MASAKKLPSGNWRVFLFIGKDSQGRRQYKSFTAETKKEAEFEAAEYNVTRKEKLRSGMTVGDAVDRYIRSKDAVLSPATVREYKQCRKNALVPLEGVKLADLTQEMVQVAMNDYAKTHAPKTVRNAHGLLSATLLEYHPDFHLRTKLPKKVKPDFRLPENDNIKALLGLSEGTEMKTVIMLASALGLRRSEICALTWADVDFDSSIIHVNKALVLSDQHEWVLKKPKSYAGTRDVEAPVYLMDYLRALPRDASYDPNASRIVSLQPDSVTYYFTKLRDQCGLSFRFHDLRHYNASVMLALGVPDKYAMERLGQSTPGVLKDVYQHLMKDKKKQVSDSINRYFDDLNK